MERGIKGTVRKKRTEIYPRALRSRKINCSFMANDFCLSALDDVIPLNITKSTNNKNEYEDFYALTTKLTATIIMVNSYYYYYYHYRYNLKGRLKQLNQLRSNGIIATACMPL